MVAAFRAGTQFNGAQTDCELAAILGAILDHVALRAASSLPLLKGAGW